MIRKGDTMEIIKEENKIVVLNEQQKEIAYIIFPKLENNLVTLKSTYVDETLRGKGIAHQLLVLFCDELRRTNRKAIVTCSYAKIGFKASHVSGCLSINVPIPQLDRGIASEVISRWFESI